MSNQPQRYASPLRYPGGKGKVANFVKLLFLENNLLGAEYVEPYAGGASVALSLLFEDFASHIHINDINRGVHAFWSAVLNDTDALCARITDTPTTIDVWQQQRTVQQSGEPDPLDLAFSTFFLNRTNRSGIISGGVIGGQDQTGAWKIDARYNVPELIRRVQKVARFGSRITLTRLDALALLDEWCDAEAPKALIYLDPPYYVKGGSLYDNFYRHDDHVAIAAKVQCLAQPWVVSYDAAPEVLDLYEPFSKPWRYALQYSAHGRHAGSEVMFFSDGIVMPDSESPAGISVLDVDRARQIAFSN
jgi:DNA adenine methylase